MIHKQAGIWFFLGVVGGCTDNSRQSHLVAGVFSLGLVGSVALTQSAPVVEIVCFLYIFYNDIKIALMWKYFDPFTEWLTVLAETWLTTDKGLDASRFVCFLCKVGIGGDGTLCKFTSSHITWQRCSIKLKATVPMSFQAYLYLITQLRLFLLSVPGALR